MAEYSDIEYTQTVGVPRGATSSFRGERLATKRPSYLKRQKEQQRLARANNKREARRERKRASDEMNAAPEPAETDETTAETIGTTHPPEPTEIG